MWQRRRENISLLMASSLTNGTRPRGGSYYNGHALVRGKVLGMTLNCCLCHTHTDINGLPCGRDVGRASLLMASCLTHKGTRPRGGSYYNGHAMVVVVLLADEVCVGIGQTHRQCILQWHHKGDHAVPCWHGLSVLVWTSYVSPRAYNGSFYLHADSQ